MTIIGSLSRYKLEYDVLLISSFRGGVVVMQVLRNENSSARVIEEYLAVMRREVNPSKEYRRLIRFVLIK
jgi:Flp pilus assembly protein protease CpaA